MRLLGQSGGEAIKFAGFPEESFHDINQATRRFYNKAVEQKETSLRGYNWGRAGFDGALLQFDVQNKQAFEIPLSEIANTAVTSNNEVSVEMKPLEGNPNMETGKRLDTLVEMRFFIPNTGTSRDEQKDGDDGDDAMDVDDKKENVRGSDDEEENAAQVFCDTIKDRAEIGRVVGDSLTSIKEILILTPRYPLF